MIQSISGLTQIVNLKSVLISALAVLSTWLCLRLGIKADFPLTLIATAIVFPLVFSISTAYTRREKALEEYGALKANGRALYLASRDWVSQTDAQRDVEVKSALHQGLEELGEGVVASGHADDGLVEAIELPGRSFAVGVLWHPEEDEQSRVVGSFVDEARNRMKAAAP